MTLGQAPDPSKLVPFPSEQRARVSMDLDLSAKVAGPSGWVDLEDGLYYSLHAESFGESGTSWRKKDLNADWIEGSYTVSAVRENVTETVSVWVRGETHFEFRTKVEDLITCFSQLNYLFMKRIEDVAEYWTCPSPADYTIRTQHEYIHARIGVFAAQVIRLPTVQIFPSTADEV